MTDLFCFLMGVDSIQGTLLESRIQEICNKGHKGHEVYTLKAGAGQLYRNLKMYTDEQLKRVATASRDNFYFFDYVKNSDAAKVTGTQYF